MITCERAAYARARGRALGVAFAVGLALDLASGVARAQAEDEAAARALFAEARRLVKEGAYDKACPKLEAASKLYPGSGVLLNLGDCFEHTNRLASAWAVFGDAAANARRAGRADDEAEAKRRQAALEPRLQRISIHVTHDVPTLVVRRDQTVVNRGAWDTALPVDSGTHVITAEASGRTSWSRRVAVTGVGQTVTVDVPALNEARTAAVPVAPVEPVVTPPSEPALPAATEPSAPTSKPGYWTARRVAGVTTAGAGVVGVGVGGILGLLAKSKYDTALGETGAARHNDSATAVSGGDTATVVMAVGGAVAAVGLVVWLTAPSTSVQLTTTGRQVVARWTF